MSGNHIISSLKSKSCNSILEETLEFNTISVIGLGYIGLPTAATFANHGKKVLGMDKNKSVIDTLNKGELHIHENGLEEFVKKAVSSGNLSVFSEVQPADAAEPIAA